MRMPSIVLCLLFTSILAGRADEYRFHHMTGVTGLANVVFDTDGKETTIIITKDSDAVSVAVLDALLGAELYGTQKPSKVRGAFFDQPIVFTGEFTSKEKRTPVVPNGATPEPYRDFKITGIKVGFPFYRFVTAPKGNEIDGPFVLEAHFGFDSLLPGGIKRDGKDLDLTKHSIPPKDE